MAKKFRDLVGTTMSPDATARAAARTKSMLAEMHLQELRRARQLSQEELADRLGASQPDVSKIESRADMYVSTIRRYVEAMGGELDIVARFPDGSVRINQFHDLEPPDRLTLGRDLPSATCGGGAAVTIPAHPQANPPFNAYPRLSASSATLRVHAVSVTSTNAGRGRYPPRYITCTYDPSRT